MNVVVVGQGEVVELYTDHRGLKTFVQRLSQAKETYTQKLSELGKGFSAVIFSCKIIAVFSLSWLVGWRNTLGVISESKV